MPTDSSFKQQHPELEANQARTCWFHFEGENEGDAVPSETDEEAATIHYDNWKHEVEEGAKIFVRSKQGVTEWSVYPVRTLVAQQLNIKEQ